MFVRRSIVVRLLALALFVPTALVACSEEGEVKVEEDGEVDPNLPPPNVDLPEPPPASAFEIPEKNPDGTLRVEGLIHHQDNHLGGQVEVKGIITYMSKDCDPKRKKDGETCPEPHLFIQDAPDARARLQIVGYDDDFLKRTKPKVGDEHVFKGTYQKVAQGFVATEDGLVLLDYLDDEPVIEPK